MGKYKQWLHHQEVGARLRDEIAAHEAERERVQQLAPTRPTSLPDLTNPIIAALLGQGLLDQAPVQALAHTAANGASATVVATGEAVVEVTTVEAEAKSEQAAAKIEQQAAKVEARAEEAEGAVGKNGALAAKTESQTVQEEIKVSKGSTGKHKAVAGGSKQPEKQLEKLQEKPAEKQPSVVAQPAGPPDTIDPLLEALLARAESEPDDPLAALNALASKGPNLTRGEAPLPASVVDVPQPAPAPTGESALQALMGQRKLAGAINSLPDPVPAAVTVSAEVVTVSETTLRAEGGTAGEKGRVDTDELVAARPSEGYTEPRLAVPWWLRSAEPNQDGKDAEQAPVLPENAEDKQRLSVSLPFENEEDMRLHESVERWWQRWRQQG